MKNEDFQTRLNKLEQAFAGLESGINEIKELMKSSRASYPSAEAGSYNKKTAIEDLRRLYNSKSFNDFYNILRHHAEWCESHPDDMETDKDEWDRSCYDEAGDLFARIVNCLMYFDTFRVAQYISAINKNERIDPDDKINDAFITVQTSTFEWEEHLTKDLGKLVGHLLESGEATAKEPYKHWQVGRLHLESSVVTYQYEEADDDVVKKLHLFWTPEASEAGNLY